MFSRDDNNNNNQEINNQALILNIDTFPDIITLTNNDLDPGKTGFLPVTVNVPNPPSDVVSNAIVLKLRNQDITVAQSSADDQGIIHIPEDVWNHIIDRVENPNQKYYDSLYLDVTDINLETPPSFEKSFWIDNTNADSNYINIDQSDSNNYYDQPISKNGKYKFYNIDSYVLSINDQTQPIGILGYTAKYLDDQTSNDYDININVPIVLESNQEITQNGNYILSDIDNDGDIDINRESVRIKKTERNVNNSFTVNVSPKIEIKDVKFLSDNSESIGNYIDIESNTNIAITVGKEAEVMFLLYRNYDNRNIFTVFYVYNTNPNSSYNLNIVFRVSPCRIYYGNSTFNSGVKCGFGLYDKNNNKITDIYPEYKLRITSDSSVTVRGSSSEFELSNLTGIFPTSISFDNNFISCDL